MKIQCPQCNTDDSLYYEEQPTWISFKIIGLELDDEGMLTVKADYSKPDWSEISDSRLVCDNCDVQLTADDFGAEEWETE